MGGLGHNRVNAADFLHRLNKTHISCPSASDGIVFVNSQPLCEALRLGGKGPKYSRKQIFFSGPFGDAGYGLRLRKDSASRIELHRDI